MREIHRKYMREAIKEADRAFTLGEIPIGAVVVKDNQIIGRGFNRRETWQDPTAHAEILAIRDAASRLGAWRLTGAQIYVTLEPCPMCAGAIVNARLKTLVFGAMDMKAGAVSSLMNLVQDQRLNHQVDVIEGICQEECSLLLKRFFAQLRSDEVAPER